MDNCIKHGMPIIDSAGCEECKNTHFPSSRSPAGYGAWIDVDIEMPEGNKPVLIFYETPIWKNPAMAIAINFDGAGVFRIVEKGGAVKNATHWMPLPDAP